MMSLENGGHPPRYWRNKGLRYRLEGVIQMRPRGTNPQMTVNDLVLHAFRTNKTLDELIPYIERFEGADRDEIIDKLSRSYAGLDEHSFEES